MILITQEIIQTVTDNNAFIVLIKSLAKRASNEQSCFPSLSTIAEDTGLAKSTVQKAIDFLVKKRVILRQKIKNRDGSWSCNHYKICTNDLKVVKNTKKPYTVDIIEEQGDLSVDDTLYRTAVDPIPHNGTTLYRTTVTNSQEHINSQDIKENIKRKNSEIPKFDPSVEIQNSQYQVLTEPIRQKFLEWFLKKPGKRNFNSFNLNIHELLKADPIGQKWLLETALEKQVNGRGWQGIKADWCQNMPKIQFSFSKPITNHYPESDLYANIGRQAEIMPPIDSLN